MRWFLLLFGTMMVLFPNTSADFVVGLLMDFCGAMLIALDRG